MLCALVTGCGGNDDGNGGASSSGTTQSMTPPTTTTTSTPTQSRQVERYLRDNFGGTGSGTKAEWYDHVVEVSVSGTVTTVKTDLPTGHAGKKQARQICDSVRGTIPGLTDEVHVTGLAAGSALASCVP
jgi:hypothetical protein